MKLHGRAEIQLHALTSALDGGKWLFSCPGHFTSKTSDPSTQWTGCWATGERCVRKQMNGLINLGIQNIYHLPFIQYAGQALPCGEILHNVK